MAIVAAAMMGACLGFLWFNCNPARVFMGDTGSLALGGLIGYIAIVIRQEFMLFFRRRNLRHRGAVGDHAGELLQVHAAKIRRGAANSSLLAAPPSLPAQRWTESQVSRPLLAHQRHACGYGLATVKLR